MTATPELSTTIELEHDRKRLNYFGQYFKELRLAEGMTQYEASSNIGISRGRLQKAEYGHNIRISTILKLVDYYGLSTSEFFSILD